MRAFVAFSSKDIRTCARILYKASEANISNSQIIEFAQQLSKVSTNVTKRKRTPEERDARKEALADAKYGRLKVKP